MPDRGGRVLLLHAGDGGDDALMEPPIERRERRVQPNRCWVPYLAFSYDVRNGAKDSGHARDFFLRILRPSPFVPVSWIGVDADRTNQTAWLTT